VSKLMRSLTAAAQRRQEGESRRSAEREPSAAIDRSAAPAARQATNRQPASRPWLLPATLAFIAGTGIGLWAGPRVPALWSADTVAKAAPSMSIIGAEPALRLDADAEGFARRAAQVVPR